MVPLLMGPHVITVLRQEHCGEPRRELSTAVRVVDRCLEMLVRAQQSNLFGSSEVSKVMTSIWQLLAVRAYLSYEVQNDKEITKCRVATNIRILIGTTTEWVELFAEGGRYERVLSRSSWGTLIDDAEKIDKSVGLVLSPHVLDGSAAPGR